MPCRESTATRRRAPACGAPRPLLGPRDVLKHPDSKPSGLYLDCHVPSLFRFPTFVPLISDFDSSRSSSCIPLGTNDPSGAVPQHRRLDSAARPLRDVRAEQNGLAALNLRAPLVRLGFGQAGLHQRGFQVARHAPRAPPLRPARRPAAPPPPSRPFRADRWRWRPACSRSTPRAETRLANPRSPSPGWRRSASQWCSPPDDRARRWTGRAPSTPRACSSRAAPAAALTS